MAPTRRAARGWLLAGGILLVASVGLYLLVRPRGVPVSVQSAVRGPLTVPILCEGALEPPPAGELRAAESGTAAEILAGEGELVRHGQPLLRLDNPDLIARAHDARAEVLQIEGERVSLASELDRAEREAAHAKTILDGDSRLIDRAAISRATFDSDDLAYRQAKARAESLRTRVSSGLPSRIALAQSRDRDLRRRVDALTIRAPADGVVYGLPRRAGEAVAAGQLVASVAHPERHQVRVRVDQPDLPRVAVGERLIVAFDGLPEERWEGKVDSVASGLRDVGGRQVGEVLGEIRDPSRKLPPNALVNVQIVIGEKKSALVVPRAALHRESERRFVYLLRSGRAIRRDVSVGLLGLSEVEITGGLQEGDVVILETQSPLAQGVRVVVAKGS